MKSFLSWGFYCLAVLLGAAWLSPAEQDSADGMLPALVEVLAQSDDAQFQLDILKGMSEGLKGRREVRMPAGWEALAARLGKSPNSQVRELTQSLSLTFGSAMAMASLRQTLLDATASPAARGNALESLLQVKDPTLPVTLRQLLKDEAVRGPALRGLAAYDDGTTPPAILEVYPSLTVMEKKDALNTLVSRASFARGLLAAVATKIVPARDLTADIVQQLRRFKDSGLNQQVEKLWGVARESEADKLKEIARYKSLLQTGPAGDLSRGRAVFARVCQQCHLLFDVGGKVGPDITGSHRGDLDYILENILDPNAVIPNDYRTMTVETKDDRVITGIVVRQDANAVTIMTANEELVIPRNEIVSLIQGEISMMPEGLMEGLTEREVRDLIAYLKTPAQVPLPPEGEGAP